SVKVPPVSTPIRIATLPWEPLGSRLLWRQPGRQPGRQLGSSHGSSEPALSLTVSDRAQLQRLPAVSYPAQDLLDECLPIRKEIDQHARPDLSFDEPRRIEAVLHGYCLIKMVGRLAHGTRQLPRDACV